MPRVGSTLKRPQWSALGHGAGVAGSREPGVVCWCFSQAQAKLPGKGSGEASAGEYGPWGPMVDETPNFTSCGRVALVKSLGLSVAQFSYPRTTVDHGAYVTGWLWILMIWYVEACRLSLARHKCCPNSAVGCGGEANGRRDSGSEACSLRGGVCGQQETGVPASELRRSSV